MSESRWYIVADKKDGAACLVEASNKAQAFRRAGEFYCTARPASVDEALRLTREGRDVVYAPTVPEQLDLEDSVVTGATSPASVKEGSDPGASGPSDAPGPLSEEPHEPDWETRFGVTMCKICGRGEDAHESLPKVTDLVPEAKRTVPVNDGATGHHERPHDQVSPPRQQRKASEVFGAGFGPRSEPDVG